MRVRPRWRLGVGLVAAGLLAGGMAQVAAASDNKRSRPDQTRSDQVQGDLALAANGVPIGFAPRESAWTTNDRGSVLGTAPCNGNTFCPMLLSTDDGGATWTEEPLPDFSEGGEPSDLYAVEADGKTLQVMRAYDANWDYVTYVSYDGAAWQQEDFGQQLENDVDDVAVLGGHAYVAVDTFDDTGSVGTLYRAPVGSDQWEEVPGVIDEDVATTNLATSGDTGLGVNEYDTGHKPRSRLVTTTNGADWTTRKDPCGDEELGSTWGAVDGQTVHLLCYAYPVEDVDVLSSSDAGQTFSQAGKFDLGFKSVEEVRADEGLLAVGYVRAANGCAVATSADGGQTWRRSLDAKGYPKDLRFTDADHATVLCGGGEQDSTNTDVYRTTDGGQTWQPLGLRPTGAVPDWLDPVSSSWTSNEHGYVLGWTPCADQQYCAALVETQDGGQSWTERSAPDLTWRNAAHKRAELFFAERDGKSIGLVRYKSARGSAANESFASYDGGQSWQQEDFGFDDGSSLLLDMSATSAYVHVALEEDNGSGGPSAYSTTTVRAPVGADDWSAVGELTDGGTYADDDINARGDTGSAYIGGDYFDGPGPRFLTTSDGESWTEREDPCGPNATPLFMPAGNDRIYAFCASPDAVGEQQVMVSEDGGATFTKVSGGPEQAVSPQGYDAVGDTVVVGDYKYDINSPGCLVQVSSDGGATFQRDSLEGPDGYAAKVREIQLDEDGTGTALCTVNGEPGGGVVSRTTDGGQTWQALDPTG